MFLAREGPVHDVADALFLARSVWEAGIRDVHRAEDHAEVGIDRPVSPVADFRNLRIRSAITSAPDDRPSFSSGLGSIPSGSLGLWFLRRSGQVGAQPSVVRPIPAAAARSFCISEVIHNVSATG